MTGTASSEKIRIGLIGMGQRGQDHLRKYQKIPNAEIVAAADMNEALAQRVAAEYGIAHVYSDYQALLARDDLDAVDICLHNNLHRPVAVAAMQAGKHVYCEKPMAGSYADALAMHTAAQTLGRQLSIQLLMLFQPETRAAKALVDAGALGELYHARSTGFRRRGRPYVDGYGTPTFVQKRHSAGGALYDMGIYHIATVLYLLGNPSVERISGQIYQKTPMDARRQAASGYDVEELGVGLIHFAGGVTLDLIEAWAIHLDNFEGSSVVGSLGGVRLEPFGYFHNLADLDLNSTANLDGWLYRAKNVHGEGDEYDGAEQHFVAALQGRVPLLPSAELALNTSLICEGIYLSSRLGREVTAAEVQQQSASIDPA